MSPLSEKYFQYRMQQQQEPPDPEADTDRYCPSCGYNLRGLPRGRTCPECGASPGGTTATESSPGFSRKRSNIMPDPLLAVSDDTRRRWHLGLGLATLALAVVLIGQWTIFLGRVFGATNIANPTVIVVLLSMTVVWIPAVWLATPPDIDQFVRRGRGLRWFIRLTQLLWLPGFALVTMRLLQYAGTNTEGTLHVYSLLLRGGAGVGFLAYLWLMMRMAHFAELEDATRRINNALFFLSIPVVIIAAAYGRITWLAAVLLTVVYVAWTWLMIYLVLGFHQLYQHVRWARRQAVEAPARDERIRATRNELEQQVQSKIRPTSPTPPKDNG